MISQKEVLQCLGLTMLIYEYEKSFILRDSESIDSFMKRINEDKKDKKDKKSTNMIQSMTQARQKVLRNILESSPEGRVVFINDKDSDLQAGITKNDEARRVTVVFRGSESMKDWMYDLMVAKKCLDDNVKVHRGFYHQLTKNGNMATLITTLKDMMNSLSTDNDNLPYDIYITGHSLGGALATLFGYFVSKDMPEYQFKVVSFGSPRVGNHAFRYNFDQCKNLKHYRITNRRDVITSVPMYKYKHTGITIHLRNKDCKIYETYDYDQCFQYSLWKCFNVFDHNIDKYYNKMTNAIRW